MFFVENVILTKNDKIILFDAFLLALKIFLGFFKSTLLIFMLFCIFAENQKLKSLDILKNIDPKIVTLKSSENVQSRQSKKSTTLKSDKIII